MEYSTKKLHKSWKSKLENGNTQMHYIEQTAKLFLGTATDLGQANFFKFNFF